MAVTAKRVAERAGVSPATVWQVLRGDDARYKPETRERILSAARELGYRPNAAAKAIRRGKFGTIGLLVPRHIGDGVIFNSAWQSLLSTLAAQDTHLIVNGLPPQEDFPPDTMPKLLREWAVDGLIVNYFSHTPEPLLRALGGVDGDPDIPVVWMNVPLEFNAVYPDDRRAAYDAVQYLRGFGHERIAYVDFRVNISEDRRELLGGDIHYSRLHRAEGYAGAMRAMGHATQYATPEDSLPNEAFAVLAREWLQGELRKPRHERVTAALAYEAIEAQTLIGAAYTLGLRVPEDLSVMCFHPEAPFGLGFRISASIIPATEMGREAVALLTRQIAQPGLKVPSRALPHVIEPGATVVPP